MKTKRDLPASGRDHGRARQNPRAVSSGIQDQLGNQELLSQITQQRGPVEQAPDRQRLSLSDMLEGKVDEMRRLTLGDLVLSVLPWPFHKDLGEPEEASGSAGGSLAAPNDQDETPQNKKKKKRRSKKPPHPKRSTATEA